MGVVTFGIPQGIVRTLATQAGIRNFVETGTYRGRTAKWAAREFADSVYTIEKSEVLYKESCASLAGERIVPLLGDSREHLPQILAKLGPAVFWLDAHWCDGMTAGVIDQCPLLAELTMLRERTADIVLIDDARLFLAAPPNPNDASKWPTIADISDVFSSWKVRPFVQVVDDVIFAIPGNDHALKSTLIEYARDRSNSFWRDFTNPDLMQTFSRKFRATAVKVRNAITQ